MWPQFPRSHGRSYLGAGGDISGVRRLQGAAAGVGAGEEEESWALTQRPSGRPQLGGGHRDLDTVAPRHTGDVVAETTQGGGEIEG